MPQRVKGDGAPWEVSLNEGRKARFEVVRFISELAAKDQIFGPGLFAVNAPQFLNAFLIEGRGVRIAIFGGGKGNGFKFPSNVFPTHRL